jgi:hypothetical protein
MAKPMSNQSLYILAAVISVASAAAGFVYGASRNVRQIPHDQPTKTEEQDEDSPSDEDSSADGDLSSVTAGFLQPCKLVRRSGICCIVTPMTGPCGQTLRSSLLGLT